MGLKIDISVCRVCMKSGPDVTLFDEKQYYKHFIFVTQLEASKDDGLPSSLCKKCMGRMRQCVDFKKQSEDSDKHLRSFISKVNLQFTSSVVKTDMDQSSDEYDEELLVDTEQELQQELVSNEKEDSEEDEENSHYELRHIDDSNAFTSIYKIEELEENISLHEENEDAGNLENYNTYQNRGDGEEQSEEADAITFNLNIVPEEQLEDFEEIKHSVSKNGHSNDDEMTYEEDDYQGVELLFESQPQEENYTTEASISDAPVEVQVKRRTKRLKLDTEQGHFCSSCNKEFSSKTNLMRHVQGHGGMRPHICNICDKGFTQSGSLKQHMYIHTGERPYVCHVCKRGFTQSKSLTCHLRRHTGEKPYTCDVCGLNFRQKDGLKRHFTANHTKDNTKKNTQNEDETKKFICQCGQLLLSKQLLTEHMQKEHPDIIQHICEVCSKSCVSEAALSKHVRNHQKKLHKCQVCDKEFLLKSTLTSHMNSHDGFAIDTLEETGESEQPNPLDQKIYQCSECLSSFSVKKSFLEHLQEHINKEEDPMDEQFTCDECGLLFDSKDSLDLHRSMMHKDDLLDLNVCDTCGINCATEFDLEQHLIHDHDGIEGSCELCGQDFTSKKVFEEHLQEHAGILLCDN